MRTRRIVGLVIVIVALPLLLLGLIDPLEGGIAFMLGTVLGGAARLVSRVPVPRFTWMALLTTVALGALTLLLVLVTNRPEQVRDATIANPVLSMPLAMIGLWAYRLGALATFAGGVWYVVRITRAIVDSSTPTAGASPPVGPDSRRRPLAVAGIATAALLAAGAVGAAIVMSLLSGYAPPEFPTLAENPQASLHGTVAYFSDSTRCVRIVAAAGIPSRDVYCIADEPVEKMVALGKPVGPHLAWLPDGRLSITMYRMSKEGPGPEVFPNWERIVDARTGTIEEVPAADVPPTAPVTSHPTLSPSGGRLETTSDDGHATVTLTEGGRTRTLLDVTGNGETYRMAPAYWAPNFEWIAADDGRILIVSPKDPSATWVLTTDSGTTVDERFDRFAITADDILTDAG